MPNSYTNRDTGIHVDYTYDANGMRKTKTVTTGQSLHDIISITKSCYEKPPQVEKPVGVLWAIRESQIQFFIAKGTAVYRR